MELTYKELHKLLDIGIEIHVNTPSGVPAKILRKYIKEEEGVLIKYNDGTETKCAISHHLEIPFLKPANYVKIGDSNGIKTVVSVERVPIQEWYDFEIDREDGLYVQNDIVHHNSGKSVIISVIAEFFRRLGLKGILLVPNINLLTQFKNDIESYNLKDLADDVQLIGAENSVGSVSDLTKTLTISTWQSMQNYEGSFEGLDFVIVDECLHPETLIKTPEGFGEIQKLNKGDLVLTVNEETLEEEIQKIVKVHKNLRISENEKMLELALDNGRTLRITGNHKILTEKGWKRADELTLEDNIVSHKI